MPQLTLKKFNYPDNLLKTYKYWNLLLRPEQATLGAMVLICKLSRCALGPAYPVLASQGLNSP